MKMTLYLDMDGVIADFFSLLAKENNVKHWKSIKDKERALMEDSKHRLLQSD